MSNKLKKKKNHRDHYEKLIAVDNDYYYVVMNKHDILTGKCQNTSLRQTTLIAMLPQ